VLFAFSPRESVNPNLGLLNLNRMQINDLITVNNRLVAVGERGIIAVSETNGHSWEIRHSDTETPVTLTDISRIDDNLLLAVGHDSVMLRSEDGGLNWEAVMRDSELGEPLLGTWSADGQRIFAYGSFGKFMVSNDAGATFTDIELPIFGEHLAAMAGNSADTRMLVGEMGLVLRSLDDGESWEKLDAFYDGSLFGAAHLQDDNWVAYGMRGHVFFTSDNGDNWSQIDIGSELPLYGHTLVNGGKQIMMVGTGGIFVSLTSDGELLESGNLEGLGTLTSAVVLPSGEVFVAGQRGLTQSTRNLVAAWNE
jgi:photosystem II stability/assembly factor-like uncharacterized protein